MLRDAGHLDVLQQDGPAGRGGRRAASRWVRRYCRTEPFALVVQGTPDASGGAMLSIPLGASTRVSVHSEADATFRVWFDAGKVANFRAASAEDMESWLQSLEALHQCTRGYDELEPGMWAFGGKSAAARPASPRSTPAPAPAPAPPPPPAQPAPAHAPGRQEQSGRGDTVVLRAERKDVRVSCGYLLVHSPPVSERWRNTFCVLRGPASAGAGRGHGHALVLDEYAFAGADAPLFTWRLRLDLGMRLEHDDDDDVGHMRVVTTAETRLPQEQGQGQEQEQEQGRGQGQERSLRCRFSFAATSEDETYAWALSLQEAARRRDVDTDPTDASAAAAAAAAAAAWPDAAAPQAAPSMEARAVACARQVSVPFDALDATSRRESLAAARALCFVARGPLTAHRVSVAASPRPQLLRLASLVPVGSAREIAELLSGLSVQLRRAQDGGGKGGRGGRGGIASVGRSLVVHGKLALAGDGEGFTAAVPCTETGRFLLDVRFRRRHVFGGPFWVRVTHGAVAPGACTAAVVGPGRLAVVRRDVLMNACPADGDWPEQAFAVTVTPGSKGRVAQVRGQTKHVCIAKIEADAVDAADAAGAADAADAADAAEVDGDDGDTFVSVDIKIGGEHIRNSPLRLPMGVGAGGAGASAGGAAAEDSISVEVGEPWGEATHLLLSTMRMMAQSSAQQQRHGARPLPRRQRPAPTPTPTPMSVHVSESTKQYRYTQLLKMLLPLCEVARIEAGSVGGAASGAQWKAMLAFWKPPPTLHNADEASLANLANRLRSLRNAISMSALASRQKLCAAIQGVVSALAPAPPGL